MESNKRSGPLPAKKKSFWGTRMILIIVVVVMIGGAAAWYYISAQAKSQAQAGATTSTATVQRGDISLTASGQGTLTASDAVNMSFSTRGKVGQLNVKLGDMVKKDDVLASLENANDLEANLASARVSLLQAQHNLAALQKKAGSALAAAFQTLTSAQSAYNDALKVSQLVAAGTRCSPEMVNKYKAALQQATEKLSEQKKLDPNSEATTVAEYDFDTTVANYNYCITYTDTEKTDAKSTLEVAKANLQDAEDKYKTLKEASGIDPDTLSIYETKLEAAQTLVDKAQEARDGATLKATIAGKITYLAAGKGTIVDTSTFLTISDVSHPKVTFNVDDTDLDKLVVGNSAEITFTALSWKTFTGKVSVANPQLINIGPFTAAFGEVELDTTYVAMLEEQPLGMSATVTVTGKEAKNVLYVPIKALKQLKDGSYVVGRVGTDGQSIQQVVGVGLEDGTNAEITSGLQEGDVVSLTVKSSSSSSQGSSNVGGGMSMP